MGIANKLKVVVWNIGFIEKEIGDFISNQDTFSIIWMKHKYSDRFFADPFLLDIDDKFLYVLAEEYIFAEGKGRIALLSIDIENKELVKNERLIDTDYHLSYPFVYKNQIYAEQSKSGKWISYSKEGVENQIVANCGLIDSTILDDGKNEWVFATKINKEKEEALRLLYRYKLVNGEVNLSSERLIKDDLKASRPGGGFFSVDGQLYRVAQTSTEKIYGESIDICRVVKNTEDEYQEEVVMNVNSHSEKRFNKGLHTFNPYSGFIIVDGFEMQNHPIQKLKRKVKTILG